MPEPDEKAIERILQRELAADERVLDWAPASTMRMPEGHERVYVILGIAGFFLVAWVTGIWLLAWGALLVIPAVFVWALFLGRKPYILAATDKQVMLIEVSPDWEFPMSKQRFLYNELLPIVVARAQLGPSTLHLRPAAGERIMLGWSRAGQSGARMERLLETLQSKVGVAK